MRHNKDRSFKKLLRLLLTGEFTHLDEYLKDTPAVPLVSRKIEKTALRNVVEAHGGMAKLSEMASKGRNSYIKACRQGNPLLRNTQ